MSTTKTNATKTNAILNTLQVQSLFMKSMVECEVTKKVNYCTDTYTGFSDFSVNTKKTKYIVYCDDFNFALVKNAKTLANECILTENRACTGTDKKYRNNIIECNNTDILTKIINLVVKNTPQHTVNAI